MDTPQWIRDIEAHSCECVSCSECGGSGNVWFAFGGRKYLGCSRWDDLDEMETCEECHGSGIVETCDRCHELDEAYADLEEQEEREHRVRFSEA